MFKPSTKFSVVRQAGGASSSATGLYCNYSPRICMRTRIDGYDYCIRHILEDKSSPYKQCTYVSSKTNRRCSAPAPRMEKRDGFCPEHGRKTTQSRLRMMARQRPQRNLHTLLDELDHHMVKPCGEGRVKHKGVTRTTSRITAEFFSSSDSETEQLTVKETWKTDEESDMESIDSEQEDPLKHAGVYTAEEVASILRDKLIRLQSLYLDQFRYLHHMLREKRRKYLRGLSELGVTEVSGGDSSMPVQSVAEKAAQDKLFALQRYHRRFGKEALLHRQCKERRMAFSEGANYKAPVFAECNGIKDDGSKCTARSLPLAKHCMSHITSDKRQVLFRNCNHGNRCRCCVIAIDDGTTCDLHCQLLALPYRLNRKQEDAEMKDEPVDVVGITDAPDDFCQDSSASLSHSLSIQPIVEIESASEKANASKELT